MYNQKRNSRIIGSILAFTAILAFSPFISPSAHAADAPLRQRTSLDADWAFHRGDLASNETNQAIAATYDDHQWQRVQVPHDYGLDGSYSTNNARNHGYLPSEPAWYRKHFSIPQSAQGKTLQLEFGGVFRDSQVWLNGQFLGHHANGYTGFFYDITKAAQYGADNIITVRVDPRQPEGWWYEGGGIYRHVYLHVLAPLHVATWGAFVTSKVPNGDQGADAEAEITIQTTVKNDASTPANCTVVSEILSPDGASLKSIKSDTTAPANDQDEVTQQTVLAHPLLWSPDSPQLYQLRTTILQDGHPVDSTTTTFGIRTVVFDANKGFFLNGKHVEIFGVANDQEFPAFCIAVPDSLLPWRVTQLLQLGCNAWRTAHNPPNEAVLDACDRLGMLVMDENRHLGDSELAKTPAGTTATNFADLDFMIQRDRNHPGIIMWSLCNEERLQGKPEGVALFSAMMKEVHKYDVTRPITSAMHNGWTNPESLADVEDIVGVNYNIDKYDKIRRAHPDKPMFGSEDTNDKTTRGEYADNPAAGMRSCYNLSDTGWLAVVNRPFMAGSFTWTGFDYKGEPNPYGWPDISNNTGLLDVCGFPKDKAYYFKSCWTDKPMVHLMPTCWNWPGKEGQTNRVIAFSNAREVELFLNGKSLGVQTMTHDGHVEWAVPYAPGQLLAKASTDGRVVATDQVETTGSPARIQLSTDRKILHADNQDTIVVPVAILDEQGRVVPDAANRVTFQLVGGGRILGVGNGNPADHDPDRANQRNAFNGHCITLIQADTNPGELHLTASSPGLTSATLTLRVQ